MNSAHSSARSLVNNASRRAASGSCASGRGQHRHLALAALGQRHGAGDSVGEHRRVGHRPHALPQQDGPGPAQLPPDRHPMPRRLSWHPHHQHQPPHRLLHHTKECISGYITWCCHRRLLGARRRLRRMPRRSASTRGAVSVCRVAARRPSSHAGKNGQIVVRRGSSSTRRQAPKHRYVRPSGFDGQHAK